MPKINQTTWIVALSTIDSGISNELAEPDFPGIVTITNPEGGEIINFTAGTEGSSPITSYVAAVIPSGPTATVVSADLSVGGYVELSNFAFDTDYIVSISAVNGFGQGEAAYTNSFDFTSPYNSASGGTETIVDDYNGTGEKWKVHTFESSGTLSVVSASTPFRYLVVGAGGSGGSTTEGGGGGCGGVVDSSGSLSVGNIAITVGVGQEAQETGDADASEIDGVVVAGGGGQGGSGYGAGGGNSGSPLTFTGAGGSGSNQTCGGGAGASASGSSKDGGYGVTTTIGGVVSQDFAGGGGGGNRGKGTGSGASGGGNARNPNGTNGTRIGSGGGGSDFDGFGGSGFRGEVVVAYKIGVSTPAEIKVAPTIKKAQLRKQQLAEKALKKQQELEAKLRK